MWRVSCTFKLIVRSSQIGEEHEIVLKEGYEFYALYSDGMQQRMITNDRCNMTHIDAIVDGCSFAYFTVFQCN